MNQQDYLLTKRKRGQNPFVIREGKFRQASLEDSFYHLDWAEESFLSGNNDKEMMRRTFDLSKLKYITGLLLLALIILLSRVFWLQIVRGEYYYSMAEGNRLKVVSIEPKRGIIFDSKNRPLVTNEANFILYLIPNDLPHNELERDNALRRISSILDQGTADSKAPVGQMELISDSSSFYDLKNQVEKIKINSLEAYQPLFIVDNLEYQTALKLYLEADRTPGVFISNKIRRNYVTAATSTVDMRPLGASSLAHVLGYTGKINEQELAQENNEYSLIDYLGKTGIEYSYEAELKGQKGNKNIEVDALGKEKKIVSQTAPEDGHNLVLGIDYDLQKKVEDIVKTSLGKLGLKKASVVIMDPRTGEILSLVSWPAYDNNLFARGVTVSEYNSFLTNPSRPLFNRVISGEFPAGSTFKPVMAAAALQEKIINANTSFMSTGRLRVGEWFFPDWKAGGHGLTNVKKALADSVNTFFYYVGGGFGDFKGLGIDKIVKYAALFGLDKVTGIDLPNEASGFLPSQKWKEDTKNEVWYIGDTYHASIGQGDITVTPLQVANYTAAIANGGTLYEPHVVTKILDHNNNLITKIKPQVVRSNFISPENIKIVQEGMRQTITAGSGRSLNSLPVEVAGKTGTAQWSSTQATHAWFTGFAPYDQPEIAITVLVEAGGEGSTVAVPIVKEILQYYFGDSKKIN
ncbi:penicillin-binding protein 2 [Candidatus Falkowbacteria bacterium CG_4_10_14_0_8_um_filter_41_36]|uniref:Penicillin-binding protein 2 n=2 Tax=Candidatus Falkowiibacteriota TaxID=1752728 RepID=A0A2G9ZNK3_9BACT|nr:MAG: penicillin-binding protein 2 [Candidatus Falkowbacteria bacterium CG23_combo_of_CG06-09_8_20_14_all_41_10]PIZ09694.1 MAG: penicillin-binding protein 2 [Candidatus Falkowbacteria bacterium CG_4_10_14_0_8_um_filter_41_36]